MVEMRWVEREVLSFTSAGKTEKVLQYRHFIGKKVNEDGITDCWSEWIDVPTVTEP